MTKLVNTTTRTSENEDCYTRLTPNELLLSMFNLENQNSTPISYPSNNQITSTAKPLSKFSNFIVVKEESTASPPLQPQQFPQNSFSEAKPSFSLSGRPSIIGIRPPRANLLVNRETQSLSSLNPTLASALSVLKTKECPSGSVFAEQTRLMYQKKCFPVKVIANCDLEPEPTPHKKVSGPVSIETPVYNVASSSATGGISSVPVPSSSHIVSFNGQTTEVPDEIRCHLCNFPMKICFRKSKYKDEIREYPAYRCLRKGCQTFRAIRKVIDSDPTARTPISRKRKVDSDPVNENTADSNTAILSPYTSGTIIYIPAPMSESQVARVQQATFNVLNDTFTSPVVPLVVPSPFNAAQLALLLRTPAGIMKVQDLLNEAARSTTPPPFNTPPPTDDIINNNNNSSPSSTNSTPSAKQVKSSPIEGKVLFKPKEPIEPKVTSPDASPKFDFNFDIEDLTDTCIQNFMTSSSPPF